MATTTTDEILQEDGAEAALTALADHVAAAEEAIRALLQNSEGRAWTIRELQDEAANGWSPSVMSIAFLRLLKAREVQVGPDLQVRAI